MARRVIFSDLHFGDKDCSLYRERVASGVTTYLKGLGPIDEVILAGDILDANISSFTRAIYGKGKGRWPKQIGLRFWLSHLVKTGPAIGKILYIPGNHDFKVWDFTATLNNYILPIQNGRMPDMSKVPLEVGTFGQSFLSGIAPKVGGKPVPLVLKYPDHQFRLGKKRVLVTHGHYLDRKQTKFADIMDALEDTNWNRKRARRLFFQRTAQYQALASAVSYVSKTRTSVDWWHKKLSDVWDAAFGGLRDEPMSAKQLTEVEKYLLHYRDLMTDVFIFGHTHEACHTNTFHKRSRVKRLVKDTRIDVWNTGSFLDSAKRPYSGSFVVVDDKPADGLKIKLVHIGKLGKATASSD